METNPIENAASSFRLFIAIELPDPIKDEIEQLQTLMRAKVDDGEVKWTKRNHFHLTLKFLGNVRSDRVPALLQALQKGFSGFGKLDLQACGLGFFPNAKRPRVMWVGVTDDAGRLALLAAAAGEAATSFTAEVPEASFSGHITFGRIRQISLSEAKLLAEAAARFADRRLGQWTANSVSLVRSRLGAEGSSYTTIDRIELAGK